MSIEFLKAVLPELGAGEVYVGVVIGAKAGATNTAFLSLEAFAEWCTTKRAAHTYFALASYGADSITTYAGRKATNARRLKSLWLDIDVGEGKGYATKRAALLALNDFCVSAGLPLPTVVDSGYGLHVYWSLQHCIDSAQWLAFSKRLHELTVKLEFRCDTVRTRDAASILRPVGALNKKRAEVAVRLLRLAAPMSYKELQQVLGSASSEPTTSQWFLDSAPAHAKDTSVTRKAKPVILGCAQMQAAIKNPNAVSEPLWRALISNLMLCENGETHCHTFSSGYSGYSFQETASKVQAISNSMARGATGPVKCDTIDELNPGVCSGCPHRLKKYPIKAPVVLGIEHKELPPPTGEYHTATLQVAQDGESLSSPIIPMSAVSTDVDGIEHVVTSVIEIPPAPFPYKRTTRGVEVQQMEKLEDGTEVATSVLLCAADIYPLCVTDARKDGDLSTYDCVFRVTGPKANDLVLSKGDLASQDLLMKALFSRTSAIVPVGKEKGVMSYMRAYVTSLTNKAYRPQPIYSGWQEDESFVLGNKLLRKNSMEIIQPHISFLPVAAACTPKGSLEEWRQLLTFYAAEETKWHMLTFLIATSSPLLKFTPVSSFVNLIRGESGSAKSTIKKIAASFWGDPQGLTVAGANTTELALFERAGAVRNLPYMIDDMHGWGEDRVAKAIYVLANGLGRNRMNKDASLKDIATWCNISTVSTNDSPYDIAAKSRSEIGPLIARSFSITMPKLTMFTPVVGVEIDSIIRDNRGVAGEVFMRYVLNNLAGVKAKIEGLVASLSLEWTADTISRFHLNVAAVTLVTTGLLRDAGIFNYSTDAVKEMLRTLIVGQAATVNNNKWSAHDLVNEYVRENIQSFVNVFSNTTLGHETIMNAVLPKAYDVIGRLDRPLGEAWLAIVPLRAFLLTRGVPVDDFIKGLDKEGLLIEAKARRSVAKGTGSAFGQIICCIIKWENRDD